MTQNKAQKAAVRQRMAETGEPYNVARHVVEAGQVPAEPPEPSETGRYATPRGEDWYERVAGEAGISVAEFRAQEEAVRLADAAEEASDRVQARAEELAEDSGEEDAEDFGDLGDFDEDGPEDWPRGGFHWERAAGEHHGHGPGPDWDRFEYLGDRLQDRVDRFRQRFDQARGRAEQMISQAERLMNAVRGEPEHTAAPATPASPDRAGDPGQD